ncbi:MAG: aminodeoxychorismate synthase component I [Oleispira sp.]|nr:aminodeoxychorismate synthase component I [Oleispira sp.]
MDIIDEALAAIECGQFSLLDNNKSGTDGSSRSSYIFFNPITFCIAHTADEALRALSDIDRYVSEGFHAVGYCTYELGYALVPRLIELLPEANKHPLLCFGIYSKRLELTNVELEEVLGRLNRRQDIQIENCSLNTTQAEYVKKVSKIKQHILDGDTYQVNFTMKYKFTYLGSPLKLYEKLRQRQRVEYGCYLDFPGSTILSRSPELFISKNGDRIVTKPMKGTHKRGETPEIDDMHIKFLATDEKTLAENVMIVDLLRNDLSRICDRGSVETAGLFEIQTYETLHQMISTVSGRVTGDISIETLFREIYPCGSITGAPKVRTMEIIRSLESEPRGVYTGAIGYISPDNSFCFNVPIRTLVLWPDGSGEMGVGSGIVYDSNINDEYEECRLKGAFFADGNGEYSLIETMRFDNGFPALDMHIERITRSARELGFAINQKALKEDLLDCGSRLTCECKVRVMLKRSGQYDIECIALNRNEEARRTIALAGSKVSSSDFLLRHKTTRRSFYNKLYDIHSSQGHYDVIFSNERGEITEGSFNNIFIRKGERWLTPPVESGLIPGIQRRVLLESGNMRASEKVIYVNDLCEADEIILTNAVRGVVSVVFVEATEKSKCSA